MLAFALVLSLTAVVGGLAVSGLHRVEQQALALNHKWLQGVGHLATMRVAVIESRDFEVKHSRTADTSYHSEYEEKLDGTAKTIGAAIAAGLSVRPSRAVPLLTAAPAFAQEPADPVASGHDLTDPGQRLDRGQSDLGRRVATGLGEQRPQIAGGADGEQADRERGASRLGGPGLLGRTHQTAGATRQEMPGFAQAVQRPAPDKRQRGEPDRLGRGSPL